MLYHNSKITWVEWKSVLVEANNEETLEFEYDEKISEFMISYGRDNGGQAYSGSTILISKFENKPAYLPVFVDKNKTIQGMIYIHNNHHVNCIRLQSFLPVPARFNIFIR